MDNIVNSVTIFAAFREVFKLTSSMSQEGFSSIATLSIENITDKHSLYFRIGKKFYRSESMKNQNSFNYFYVLFHALHYFCYRKYN
jgi:hypothetical protein